MKTIRKIGVFALCFGVIASLLVGCGPKDDGNGDGNEVVYVGKSKLDFYYFDLADQSDAKTVRSEDITEQGNGIKVNVASEVNCVEMSLSKFFETNENVLGRDFTFKRSDSEETGYAYEQVGPGQEDNANNLWKRVGTDNEAKKKAELPAGPKLYVMSPTEVGRASVYMFADKDDATVAFSPTEKNYMFTLNAHNGKTFKIDVRVKGAEPTPPTEPENKPVHIPASKLGFYYFNVDDLNTAKGLTPEKITTNENVLKVKVGANVSAVEISLSDFLTENTDILGTDFTFSRNDSDKTGYAYEQVGPGQEDNANNLWKRFGTDDEGKTKAELPEGPKLYVMSPTEVGRASVYVFANSDDKTTIYTTEAIRYEFTFYGHNEKQYILDMEVESTDAGTDVEPLLFASSAFSAAPATVTNTPAKKPAGKAALKTTTTTSKKK